MRQIDPARSARVLRVAITLISVSAGCSTSSEAPADAGTPPADGRSADVAAAAEAGNTASDADQGAEDSAASSVADALATASAPTNVLVSATSAGPGRTHTSPSMVAGGVGHDVIVAFDDTDEDLTHHAVGWARSADDGASFTDEGHFPDSPAGGIDDNYGRPCVARDAIIGNVYVGALGSAPGVPNAIAFFVSSNAGVTFNPALNAADPNLSPADYIDFPAIAVDNASGYAQGLVYVAYADFVSGGSSSVKLRLSTYTNHAFAVTEVVSPPLDSGGEASLPSVAVAPSHDVWIAYYAQANGNGGPSLAVVGSSDQGQHFGAPMTVASLHMPIAAGSFNGGLGLGGLGPDGGIASVDAYSSPQLVANPVSGNLYIAYVDATEDDKSNIYFTQSADQGQSWSTPVRVNDDTTTHDQFLPALQVSLDGTRMAIDFYDRRDDAANLLANRYGVTADISGTAVTFGPNFRISSLPFPILVGADPYLAPTYFSSRTSMMADVNYFYDAYADTLDGNLDVRLARYGVHY
jgi:hypothetical protein